MSSAELDGIRTLIDGVDREILDLLARRAQLSRRACVAKVRVGAGVRDPAREAILLASRRDGAAQRGLDPDDVERVFDAILHLSRELQARVLAVTG